MVAKSFSEIPVTELFDNPDVERTVDFFVRSIGTRILSPHTHERVRVEYEIASVLNKRKPEIVRPVLEHPRIKMLVHVSHFFA